MKKLRTLGIITAAVTLLFAGAAIIAALLFGAEGAEKPEDESSGGELVVITPEEETALAWQQNPAGAKTVKLETTAGNIVIALYENTAAEKFAASLEAYKESAFVTVGENFVQTNTAGESFVSEKTKLSPIYGAVGFAAENGKANLSLIIITDETADEIGENLVLFGQVTEGFEALSAIIASGEGGYRVKEPVAVISAYFLPIGEEDVFTEGQDG